MTGPDQWTKWDKRIRDLVIYAIAVGGVINELFFEPSPRPSALFFLASLLGIPLVMRADEKRGSRDQ